jgi:hypothetical protein
MSRIGKGSDRWRELSLGDGRGQGWSDGRRTGAWEGPLLRALVSSVAGRWLSFHVAASGSSRSHSDATVFEVPLVGALVRNRPDDTRPHCGNSRYCDLPRGKIFLSMSGFPRTLGLAIFWGVGGSFGKRSPLGHPAAWGDLDCRWSGLMQLIHHQMLAPARASTTPTYPWPPCSCVIVVCCAQSIARARREGSGPSGRGGALACWHLRGLSAARYGGILEAAHLPAPQ